MSKNGKELAARLKKLNKHFKRKKNLKQNWVYKITKH